MSGISVVSYTFPSGDGPTVESSGLGLCVNGLFAGVYLNADDIKTMANSSKLLKAQIKDVTSFTKQNFLVWNPNKCEILCLGWKYYSPALLY